MSPSKSYYGATSAAIVLHSGLFNSFICWSETKRSHLRQIGESFDGLGHIPGSMDRKSSRTKLSQTLSWWNFKTFY